MAQINQQQMLPMGTMLDRRYKIIRYLGSGGFGNTYVAEDTRLGIHLAVKEFFLRNLCLRDTQTHTKVITVTEHDMVSRYRAKFGKEARIISQFNHPGIVHVSDVFEENDTVYYVMDYLQGCSLADMVKKRGHLNENDALRYIRKVATALGYIHSKNVNHLDLKPANIMVRELDDEPIIIDFGVSKQYDEHKEETSTTPPGISEGYSPLEQYRPGGVKEFSPQSDIYALGATLYKILTGETPPSASDVNEDGLPPMPAYVSKATADAIEQAMEPRRKKRLAAVDEFLRLLPGEIDNEETVIAPFVESSGETTVRVPVPPQVSSQPLPPTPPPPPQSPEEGNLQQDVRKLLDEMEDARLSADVTSVLQHLINNMVQVEGGTFMMGEKYSWLGGVGADNKEHQVVLSSFAIGRAPVTQREWQMVMGTNPSHFKGDDLPVDSVSWGDCQKFIRKLNEMTGMTFRLPTEAEWEFAARGGKESKQYIYSGSDNIDDVAWYRENCRYKTQPVGQKLANELGLCDMSGNVWEWCQDWYDQNFYSKSPSSDPCNNINAAHRVCRGGNCCGDEGCCHVTYRNGYNPTSSYNTLGFRLAL